jgi:hypothetical protein
MLKYLRNHFILSMRNERGTWGGIAAAVAGAAVGGGMSMASSSMKKGGAGSSTSGYDIATMPQYSWNETNQKLVADTAAQNINRMNEGKSPVWWENMSPGVTESLKKQNYQTYFGTPGIRNGVVNEAVSGGAGQGLGKGATTRRKWTALQDYSNKSSLIDQFMAQQGINVMSQQSMAWPQLAAGLPSGPQSAAIPYSSQTPAQSNSWGDLATNLVGNIPWENMFSNTGGTTTTNYGGGATGSSTPYYLSPKWGG